MNENNEERFRSRYSTRTWRGCCVVPLVVVVGLLILTFAAGLFDRPIGTPRPSETTAPSTSPHRQEFISFGKAFFAIAQGADKVNERGFQELQKFSRQQGSAGNLKSAFRRAASANADAAGKYRELQVPANLAARDRCQEAIDKVGQSFTARQQACQAIIRWADNTNDKTIAQEYAQHASDVNTLTQEGLSAFADAAKANGVTEQDAHEFLPQWIGNQPSPFSNRIGEDAKVRVQ